VQDERVGHRQQHRAARRLGPFGEKGQPPAQQRDLRRDGVPADRAAEAGGPPEQRQEPHPARVRHQHLRRAGEPVPAAGWDVLHVVAVAVDVRQHDAGKLRDEREAQVRIARLRNDQ
jgi:hypothetical protein